jgi:8-oxo-dGTP diphosphatase
MAREESAVFTNMCMVTDGKGNVLVIDRQKQDWPGITFPGGHVEDGESFTMSVVREVYEETGLTVENPVLCGTKQFRTDSGARYVVFFYKATKYHGQLCSSDEGKVFWLPRCELHNQILAPDMMEMVRVMESDNLSEFYYEKVEGNWKFTLY